VGINRASESLILIGRLEQMLLNLLLVKLCQTCCHSDIRDVSM